MAANVRSVSYAFSILRVLASSGGLTLTEVARQLGIGPSNCLNLLRTLVDEGVVERSQPSKRYQLVVDWAGAKVLQDQGGQSLFRTLNPSMARFAQEFDITVGLWKVVPGRRLVLAGHAECEAPMRIRLADGQRQPLGSGAVGRALAAFQRIDRIEIARRFSEVRWRSPYSLNRYIDEIANAAIDGFAIDDGIGFPGVCSVAAALHGPQRTHLMSASFFSGTKNDLEIKKIGQNIAEFFA